LTYWPGFASNFVLQAGPVTGFRSVTGKGVVGTVDGRTVAIGNISMLTEMDTTVTSTDRADVLRRNGETVMFVAVDGVYAGLVGVADCIKAGTAEAVKALHDEGGCGA
jgi:P-type Cu+ transporter